MHRFSRLMVAGTSVLLGLLSAAASTADQERPVVETSQDEVEAFLAPLKALEADETAFADEVWALGNSTFARISDLRNRLQRRDFTPEEAMEAQREIAQHIKNIAAMSKYAVQRYEKNARVRNFRGVVLYDALGDPVGGVKEWHTAVSLDTKYSDPYNNLGMHYFHSGRYPLGFQNMDMALKLEPKNPDYCFNMAQNYLIYRSQTEEHRGWSLKKIYKEAMKLSKRAAKEAPDDFEILQDYAVNFVAAENFGVEADWREAAEAWVAARKYATTDDERFYTWLNEGRAWRTLEKNDEALRCFKEALAIMPDNELAQRLIDNLTTDE